MTNKEIQALKPQAYRNADNKDFRLMHELFCREMINSCLVYGEMYYFYQNGTWGRYAQDYLKELGEATVLRLIDEQRNDFEKAEIRPYVYTDFEGVTYSSILWADDRL